MSTTEDLRRTPLHGAHVAAGAKMVAFAGWDMPVSYTGVLDEHAAVRTRAGLFDVSHMGEVSVRGPQALAFLQTVTCNDVARLRPGRAQYSALTTPRGTFVDDLLVYALEADDYLLVTNAANAAKDLAWLAGHRTGFEVEITDVADAWALLSIQGPGAVASLQPLTPARLDEVAYYRFVRARVDGAPCIVSRTGYTGEDGFEIYVPPEEAEELWYALLASGARQGLLPAGLGARDTLRLEAALALYGNDIDDTTTVLEANLGWIVKLDKGEFIGRDALARQAERGPQRRLAGFELLGRAIARPGYPAFDGEREIGRVSSGTHSPTLRKSIGLALLPCEMAEPGSEFEIEIRARREVARVVRTPFYKRAR